MKDKIKIEISQMSKGKRIYETKKGIKNGFPNLEKWIESKLKKIEVKNEIITLESKLNKERKIWKKTQGDLFPKYKNTPTGEHPIFDLNYYTSKNKDYVEGVSTKTSKEMMEWFIRQYGIVSPNEEHITKHYKMPIWYAWRNLLDMDSANDADDNLKRNYEPFEWFNELEYLIEDDEMFYALLHQVWLFGSHCLTNKDVMFSRYGRSKVSFKDKMKMGDFLETGLHHIDKEESPDGSKTTSHNGLSSSFLTQELEQYEDDDYIIVYRSFEVKKGKSIRLSRKKYTNDSNVDFVNKNNQKINPEYLQQDEGRGWSYTTHKTVAIRLGWNINTFHFEKYLGWDKKTALKNMVRKNHIIKSQKYNPKHTSGTYSCVGRYFVKKKDILLYTDARKERELIIDPKNVVLDEYYFLNLIDFITLRNTLSLESSCSYKYKGFAQNIDEVYNPLRPVVSKYYKENPNKIIDFLKNGMNSSPITPKVLKSFFDTYNIEGFSVRTYEMEEEHSLYRLDPISRKKRVKLKDTRMDDFRPSRKVYEVITSTENV